MWGGVETGGGRDLFDPLELVLELAHLPPSSDQTGVGLWVGDVGLASLAERTSGALQKSCSACASFNAQGETPSVRRNLSWNIRRTLRSCLCLAVNDMLTPQRSANHSVMTLAMTAIRLSPVAAATVMEMMANQSTRMRSRMTRSDGQTRKVRRNTRGSTREASTGFSDTEPRVMDTGKGR